MSNKKKVRAVVPALGKKAPIGGQAVSGGKKPSAGISDLAVSRELSWRLSMIDLEGDWGWSKTTEDSLREIREKLAHLEKHSWPQLPKDHHHQVEVDGICADAKKRLRDIRRDDLSHLYSIRLSGERRVWGVLHGSVFYLLWWDPHHRVFPSKKKGT